MNIEDLIIGLVLFGFFGFLIYMTGSNESLKPCESGDCGCCCGDCCDVAYKVEESEVTTQYEDEPTTSGEAVYEYSTSTNEEV